MVLTDKHTNKVSHKQTLLRTIQPPLHYASHTWSLMSWSCCWSFWMSASDVSCRPLFNSMLPPVAMPLLPLAELAAAATTPADDATAEGVTAFVKMMPMFSVYSLSVHAVITLAAFGASSGVAWLLTGLGVVAGPVPPTIVTFVGDRAEQHNRLDISIYTVS